MLAYTEQAILNSKHMLSIWLQIFSAHQVYGGKILAYAQQSLDFI